MREKSSFDTELADRKRRREKLEKSEGYVVEAYDRYAKEDPCFYLDESAKDLFTREIMEDLYPGYTGWMNSSEQESLKALIFKVQKDWMVKQSYSNPNLYNQKDED